MMRFHIEVVSPERCIGCYSCVFACSRHLYNIVDASKVAVFVRSGNGLSSPFNVVACRFCIQPECAISCPKGALQPLPEGGVSLIYSKCEGCTTFDCIEACVIRALMLDKDTKRPIICDRCGDCAKYCPHNVFRYEEMGES